MVELTFFSDKLACSIFVPAMRGVKFILCWILPLGGSERNLQEDNIQESLLTMWLLLHYILYRNEWNACMLKHWACKQWRSPSLPEVYFALDQPSSSYRQYSTHRMRKWVGEGHHGSLLFVRHNSVHVCNLKEKSESLNANYPAKKWVICNMSTDSCKVSYSL